MTQEEFNEKMNTKDLDEIAEDCIAAYLSADCEDDTLLLSGINERFVDPEDLVFIRSVLIEELNKIAQSETDEPITDPYEQKLIRLMYTLREASAAMEAAFEKMLHKIRAECDCSGLGLLYDACDTNLPYSIYQHLGSMIFNDFFSTLDLAERAEASPLFASFYDKFDDHFSGLVAASEAAWAAYHHSIDDDDDSDDDEDENEELTYERFQEMFAKARSAEKSIDFPMVSDIHKRTLKATALLMALSEAMEQYFEGYVFEPYDPTDQWAIHNLLQFLNGQQNINYTQCVENGASFSYHQTGARLIKGGKEYQIPRAYQHKQAHKAHLDFE